MGKSSPPPPPDYAAAAQQTAQGNLDVAKYTTAANRVNQVGPDGSLTYSQSPQTTFDQAGYDKALADYQAKIASAGRFGAIAMPGTAPTRDQFTKTNDIWTATQTLSPEQQALKDKQNQMSLSYADLGQQGIKVAGGLLGNPQIDESKLAQMPQNAGMNTQQAMMQRLQPQLDRENTQSDAQLANQGIMQGSEAYNNAKTLLGQNQNDRLNNAAIQGIQTDMQARNQGIANQSSIMNQPMNMINALRTGSQVTPQNYVNPAQMATVAGPDMSGAMQGMYNAQVGNVNAQNAQSAGMMQGAVTLGAAAL